jgi:hypothetical protein
MQVSFLCTLSVLGRDFEAVKRKFIQRSAEIRQVRVVKASDGIGSSNVNEFSDGDAGIYWPEIVTTSPPCTGSGAEIRARTLGRLHNDF